MKKNINICDCDVIHEKLVNKIRNKLLSENNINIMIDLFKAFADKTRLVIINILLHNELCVCDISILLNMTKSAVSHQLKYLKKVNLVKSRRIGKEVWYSLADEHVKDIFKICNSHANEKLLSFKKEF